MHQANCTEAERKVLERALAGLPGESASAGAQNMDSPERLVQCLQLLIDLGADHHCLVATCLYFRVSHCAEAVEQVLNAFPSEANHLARQLLEMQGFKPHQMPYPLRQLPKPADYDAMVIAERDRMRRAWLADPGKVLQLHNRTGFADKQINVAKAALY